MTRVRSSRPKRQYAAIPNKMLRDDKLSIEARGFLSLLMSYSDDWTFTRSHLQQVSGMKAHKFERVMREIRERGYIDLVPIRGPSGQVLGREWLIHDDCDAHRIPENQGFGTESLKNRFSDNPILGESGTIRRPIEKKTNREEDQPDLLPDSEKKEVTTKKTKDESVIVLLQEVIGRELAEEFVSHRRAIRKPMTEAAAKMMATKLKGMPSPKDAISRSIMNGWTGVYDQNAGGVHEEQKRSSTLSPEQMKRAKRNLWEGMDAEERADYGNDFERFEKGQRDRVSLAVAR